MALALGAGTRAWGAVRVWGLCRPPTRGLHAGTPAGGHVHVGVGDKWRTCWTGPLRLSLSTPVLSSDAQAVVTTLHPPPPGRKLQMQRNTLTTALSQWMMHLNSRPCLGTPATALSLCLFCGCLWNTCPSSVHLGVFGSRQLGCMTQFIVRVLVHLVTVKSLPAASVQDKWVCQSSGDA